MTFIPSKPPSPMLARPGKREQLDNAVNDGYIIEPKLDGIRCLAVLQRSSDSGHVQLYNRQLRNITAAFPDVVAALYKYAYNSTALGRLVLDGEIYVLDGDGRPDFQLVQTRANRLVNVDATATAYPAHYAAFDVLSSGTVSYLNMRLDERRRILDSICPQLVVATYTQTEANEHAYRHAGEGLMLKHRASHYEPGARSPAWLKLKWLREVECVVGGVTHGIGKRESSFAGLLCGVYKPEDREGAARLTYVGTVGTGFDDADLENLTIHLAKLRTVTNPFVELSTDWDLLSFVHPVLRIKVRFQDYTRAGIMRFPRFIGLAE